jgi:hypothetical protein
MVDGFQLAIDAVNISHQRLDIRAPTPQAELISNAGGPLRGGMRARQAISNSE